MQHVIMITSGLAISLFGCIFSGGNIVGELSAVETEDRKTQIREMNRRLRALVAHTLLLFAFLALAVFFAWMIQQQLLTR